MGRSRLSLQLRRCCRSIACHPTGILAQVSDMNERERSLGVCQQFVRLVVPGIPTQVLLSSTSWFIQFARFIHGPKVHTFPAQRMCDDGFCLKFFRPSDRQISQCRAAGCSLGSCTPICYAFSSWIPLIKCCMPGVLETVRLRNVLRTKQIPTCHHHPISCSTG